MITPTVGRMVYFYRTPNSDPLAAIITRVLSLRSVCLAIFGEDGRPWADPPKNVLLVQPEDERPSEGQFCEWMPFQVKKPTGSESGEKAAGVQEV